MLPRSLLLSQVGGWGARGEKSLKGANSTEHLDDDGDDDDDVVVVVVAVVVVIVME